MGVGDSTSYTPGPLRVYTPTPGLPRESSSCFTWYIMLKYNRINMFPFKPSFMCKVESPPPHWDCIAFRYYHIRNVSYSTCYSLEKAEGACRGRGGWTTPRGRGVERPSSYKVDPPHWDCTQKAEEQYKKHLKSSKMGTFFCASVVIVIFNESFRFPQFQQ